MFRSRRLCAATTVERHDGKRVSIQTGSVSEHVRCLFGEYILGQALKSQDPLKSLIQLWLNLHFDKSAGAKGVCTGGSTHVSWQNSCSRVSVMPKALAAQPCIATVQHKVSTHVCIYYLILL